MIIEFKYHFSGTLPFRDKIKYEYNNYSYQFLNTDNKGKGVLIVSRKGDILNESGSIAATPPEQKAVAHIEAPNLSDFHLIGQILRNLEGLLSIYGLEEIDVNNPETSWIPETEEEKENLQLLSIKRSFSRSPSPILPLDVVARNIIAASNAHHLQTPLIFYRQGFKNFKEKRFREACMEYFFFLESLYAEGQFKTKSVKANFRNSNELQKAISDSLKDNSAVQELIETSSVRYENEIKGKSASEISDAIVDHRGKIHHFSSKDKNRWNPGDPNESEFEAVLLKRVTASIALKMVIDKTFEDDVNLSKIKLSERID